LFHWHEISHVALFRRDVAHELKQEIVPRKWPVLHRVGGNYRASEMSKHDNAAGIHGSALTSYLANS
jgi:hypothetical protein